MLMRMLMTLREIEVKVLLTFPPSISILILLRWVMLRARVAVKKGIRKDLSPGVLCIYTTDAV